MLSMIETWPFKEEEKFALRSRLKNKSISSVFPQVKEPRHYDKQNREFFFNNYRFTFLISGMQSRSKFFSFTKNEKPIFTLGG